MGASYLCIASKAEVDFNKGLGIASATFANVIIGKHGGAIEELGNEKLDEKKIEPCLIWAKEKGYVLPSKPTDAYWIFIIIGSLVGLIPGLIIIFFYNQQKATYDKEVRILMNKWIDQGSPRI